jgi:hypothetical protein
MTTSFKTLLTDCLVALGDSTGATWSRVNRMWPWVIEAMKTFPILRPMLDDHTNGALASYGLQLPTDYREIISVEYPINQFPTSYLIRKNRLDPDFYHDVCFYDVDHDYATGTNGYILYLSGPIAPLAHIMTQYLANHDLAMADDDLHFITIPDQYVDILIAQVICRAYRERLSFYMQNPTSTTNVIMQLTDMVLKAEESYHSMLTAAQLKLADSRISGDKKVDKYDRVY